MVLLNMAEHGLNIEFLFKMLLGKKGYCPSKFHLLRKETTVTRRVLFLNTILSQEPSQFFFLNLLVWMGERKRN